MSIEQVAICISPLPLFMNLFPLFCFFFFASLVLYLEAFPLPLPNVICFTYDS